MLTYKQWRTLNENVGNAIPLGVSSPQSIGVVGSNSARWEIELEEAKKKMKKKMLGDVSDEEDDEVDADTGSDGEVVSKDDAAPKDEPSDEAPEVDDEGGDEGGDEIEAGGGDEESDDEGGPPMKKAPPPMMQKKKMKKCGKKCGKPMKKEDVEDDFMLSINQMLHFDPAAKNWDGFSKDFSEDALYQPADPNSNFYDDSAPGPGSVGFAPDTRIGMGAEEQETQED